jgi:hypothetical protein
LNLVRASDHRLPNQPSDSQWRGVLRLFSMRRLRVCPQRYQPFVELPNAYY